MKEHIFYPMVNRTIRSLIPFADEKDQKLILYLLQVYPDCLLEKKDKTQLILLVLNELDRQYMRWDKGEKNAI